MSYPHIRTVLEKLTYFSHAYVPLLINITLIKQLIKKFPNDSILLKKLVRNVFPSLLFVRFTVHSTNRLLASFSFYSKLHLLLLILVDPAHRRPRMLSMLLGEQSEQDKDLTKDQVRANPPRSIFPYSASAGYLLIIVTTITGFFYHPTLLMS